MSENTTTSPAGVAAAAAAVRRVIAGARAGLVERDSLVEAVALTAVAGEHLLVIGPPGTAKSEAVRRMARGLGGQYFEYLIGRFTEPNEIFGPVDLRRLREGVVETETTGMLPEAEIAFLDEIFLGSTAILNTLLALLNERTYRRGHTRMQCPLRICVSAANALPTDDSLAAFADRFLVRIFVEPIADPRLEELLEGGWRLGTAGGGDSGVAHPPATLRDLDTLAVAAQAAEMGGVRPLLAQSLRVLRAAGVQLSDRRAVKVQRLVAAAGVLAGRTSPTAADLWPLILAIPTAEGQTLARERLRDLLQETENAALPAAAEEASLGPLARATRLCVAGRALLEAPPVAAEDLPAWRLRLEGVVREIDAGFASNQLPPDLAEVRTTIAGRLEQGDA